ncbi:MAG: phytoene/squalene synthase family protein [Thermoguttaceae bacterium]
MNPSREAIQRSYEACRRISRAAGSNFFLSFLLLPRAKRRAMEALYAFMRHTDDLADNPRSVERRTADLLQWRAAFEDALNDRLGTERLQSFPLLPAVVDAVRQYRIPEQHLRAAIDGVEMDLHKRRYETFGELEQYCHRVASAVGLACVHIWGFRDREAFEPARKCGIALQLTNILRDVQEDARSDRVYLPLEDLRQCDYPCDRFVEEMIRGEADARFDRLMLLEIARAETYYREGAELMPLLAPDGRRIFGMIMSTYHALLEKIERRPRDVLSRRVRLGTPKKLRIAARWTLLPSRTPTLS